MTRELPLVSPRQSWRQVTVHRRHRLTEAFQLSCTYKIFKDEDVVATSHIGSVTTTCILSLNDAFEADAMYRDGKSKFDDLRAAYDLDMSESANAHFADVLAVLSLRKRCPTRKAIFASHGAGRAPAFGFPKLVEGHEML